MKKILPVFLFFLASVTPAAAATTLTNVPTVIRSDPFTLTVTVSGANAGTNYLRVDLYQPKPTGTPSYFGETWNDGAWYGESDGTSYKPISIVSGQDTVADVTARVGTPSAAKYPGPGAYKLRVRRYTSDDSYSVSESVDVNIDTTAMSPTPALVPTTNPTPTAEPTAVPTVEPTAEPTITPTLVPTVEPTLEPTTKPTPTTEPTMTLVPPTPTPLPMVITPIPKPINRPEKNVFTRCRDVFLWWWPRWPVRFGWWHR